MNDEALNRMTERDAGALLSQIESSEEELLIFEIDSKDLKDVIPAVKIIKKKKQKRTLIENFFNNINLKK
jgi:hypothetical protein